MQAHRPLFTSYEGEGEQDLKKLNYWTGNLIKWQITGMNPGVSLGPKIQNSIQNLGLIRVKFIRIFNKRTLSFGFRKCERRAT
jgi:hypothetical protein